MNDTDIILACARALELKNARVDDFVLLRKTIIYNDENGAMHEFNPLAPGSDIVPLMRRLARDSYTVEIAASFARVFRGPEPDFSFQWFAAHDSPDEAIRRCVCEAVYKLMEES